MQTELTFPIVGRPDHKEAEDAFVGALEPQMALLMDSRGKGEGELNVVLPHLLARALSDLMAAMHLARHGYISQSYNSVRSAYETLDLLDLVKTDPDEARRWVETDEGHKDFNPGAVRRRLGRESFDEMYSHYSELAHPRFAGARFSVFGKREPGNDSLQVLVNVGPTMLDEFPDFWFLVMAIVPTAGRLLTATAALVETGKVAEGRWDEAAHSSGVQLKRLAKAVEGGLSGFEIDADGFAEHFDMLEEIIADANERRPDP
jgi:hypothetical protein